MAQTVQIGLESNRHTIEASAGDVQIWAVLTEMTAMADGTQEFVLEIHYEELEQPGFEPNPSVEVTADGRTVYFHSWEGGGAGDVLLQDETHTFNTNLDVGSDVELCLTMDPFGGT